jgi:hypothetical protein
LCVTVDQLKDGEGLMTILNNVHFDLTLKQLTMPELTAVHGALQALSIARVAEECNNLLTERTTKPPYYANTDATPPPPPDLFDDNVGEASVIPDGDNPLVDAHGVVWHHEHHSAAKSQTQAGAWKLRKGCDKAAAEAYIRGFQTLKPTTPNNVVSLGVAQMVKAAETAQPAAAFFALPQFAPPAVNAPTVDELRGYYESLVRSQRITADYFVTMLAKIGVVNADPFHSDAGARQRAMDHLSGFAAAA